jgi:hypothetical protein
LKINTPVFEKKIHTFSHDKKTTTTKAMAHYYPGDKIPTETGDYFLILNIEGNFITVKRKTGIPFTLSIYNFLLKHRPEFALKEIGKRNFRCSKISEIEEIEEMMPKKPKVLPPAKKTFCSYHEAKKWVMENIVPIGVNSSNRWFEYCSGRDYADAPKLPSVIPRDPAKQYRDTGWVTWKDFFRIEKESSTDRKKRKEVGVSGFYLRYGKKDAIGDFNENELIHF